MKVRAEAVVHLLTVCRGLHDRFSELFYCNQKEPLVTGEDPSLQCTGM